MLKSENTDYTYILQGGGAKLSAFGDGFGLLDRLKSILYRYFEGAAQFRRSEDEVRVPEARHFSNIIHVIGTSFDMQRYRLCSLLSLYLRGKEKEVNRRKRKHANVPCISLTLNAKILFELSAQILSGLTIALRARSPDSLM